MVLGNILRVRDFWNKHNIGTIQGPEAGSPSKEFLYGALDIVVDNLPVILIKDPLIAVWPGCLERAHLQCRLLHLLNNCVLQQCIVGLI